MSKLEKYYDLNPISSKKQKKIDEYNNKPYAVGESVYIMEGEKRVLFKIKSISGNILTLEQSDRSYLPIQKNVSDVVERLTIYVGNNPFSKETSDVRSINFGLDSIISSLDLMGDRKPIQMNGINVIYANFNPYVYNKLGKKEYYQRPLVWSVKDKQLLVESIYQNIDCGKILVRLRSWDELDKLSKNGETELAFKDVIDGKQRLHAIKSFIQCEFEDLHGNLYSDLSNSAQNKFLNHQLFSYSELSENSKDEDVLSQFLKLNFTGVQQSQEHIDFVKSLQNKI